MERYFITEDAARNCLWIWDRDLDEPVFKGELSER